MLSLAKHFLTMLRVIRQRQHMRVSRPLNTLYQTLYINSF